MWWAPIAAAGVSALGNMLGSRGGGSSRITDDDRVTADYWDTQAFNRQEVANREAFDRNAALQREFAQMGVRWRVEDAEAAGLHPLFALGGQLSGGSPVAHVGAGPSSAGALSPTTPSRGRGIDFGSMGQDITRALVAAFGTDEREKRALELRRLTAQTEGDELRVAAMRNELARKAQEDYQATPIEMMPANEFGVRVKAVQSPRLPEGMSLPDAGPMVGPRFAPHIDTESLNAPVKFWSQYQMAENTPLLLPRGNDVADIFEDKPVWFWSMVIRANTDRYGPEWVSNMKYLVPAETTFRTALDRFERAVEGYANPGANIYRDLKGRVLKFGEQFRR